MLASGEVQRRSTLAGISRITPAWRARTRDMALSA